MLEDKFKKTLSTTYFKNIVILDNLRVMAKSFDVEEVLALEEALTVILVHPRYIYAMYEVLYQRYFLSRKKTVKIDSKKQFQYAVHNILMLLEKEVPVQLSRDAFYRAIGGKLGSFWEGETLLTEQEKHWLFGDTI